MKQAVSPGTGKSPCERYDCHRCCTDTQMTLSHEDIEKITEAGHRDFFIEGEGFLQLKNVEGSCIFLQNGKCRIYSRRPLGCRFYPVIWDLDAHEVFRDDICPHRHCFSIEPWHLEALERAIAVEEWEREERMRKRGILF